MFGIPFFASVTVFPILTPKVWKYTEYKAWYVPLLLLLLLTSTPCPTYHICTSALWMYARTELHPKH